MQIPPCPNTLDGNHVWRYDLKRTHKRAGVRYVYCLECKQTAQESENGVKFTSAREFAEVKTVTGSYRTWKRRKDAILKAGYDSVRDYIDNSPIVPKK